MQKGSFLTTLLRSDKTVFTFKDVALLWQDAGPAARVRLNYYVKKGDLVRIRKGIYVKNENYNRLELATRVFTPSYVSFETVLVKEGLIFQTYEQIFVASYLTREVDIDNQRYHYRKIKTDVLTNTFGIDHRDETAIAGKERAFLDTLYIHLDYQFDNLRSLDWEKAFDILPIYGNKQMAKRINRLYSQTKAVKKI